MLFRAKKFIKNCFNILCQVRNGAYIAKVLKNIRKRRKPSCSKNGSAIQHTEKGPAETFYTVDLNKTEASPWDCSIVMKCSFNTISWGGGGCEGGGGWRGGGEEVE